MSNVPKQKRIKIEHMYVQNIRYRLKDGVKKKNGVYLENSN